MAINGIASPEELAKTKSALTKLKAPLQQFLTATMSTARELKTVANTFRTSYIQAKRRQEQQAKVAAKAFAKQSLVGRPRHVL
eukprot:2787679-Lingulodinium_polyedra.AAC.1